MNKNFKRFLKLGVLLVGAGLFATSCNANFCSVVDKAHMLYRYDTGLKYDESDNPVYDENGILQFANPEITSLVQSLASSNSVDVPSANFFKALDDKTYTVAVAAAAEDQKFICSSYTKEDLLFEYGYIRYAGTTTNKKGKEVDTLFANYDLWVAEINASLAPGDRAEQSFIKAYKNSLTSYVSSTKTCITLKDGYYGKDGKTYITGKSWGYAWKQGLIEGLIIYPVAWFADTLAGAFTGAGLPAGYAALISILIVTIVVRGLLILATFKQTMSQQKMQALQPELAKIQAKHPNSNTNQYEKNAMAQEQMALYKKHGINPLSSIITLIIQFPIFIGVWGALSGASCLATGSVLGLYLSDSIKDVIFTWNLHGGAWWTAAVLFLLMTATQIVASRLPTWLQKGQVKKVARLGNNPAQDQQNKTMKFMQIFMVLMIVVMGFMLPAGMGVYWLFTAIIQMVQTIIVQNIMNKKKGAN